MNILHDLFLVFGWLSFLALGAGIVLWLDKKNYWMPPIYLCYGVAAFIVTWWVTAI